MNTRMGIHCNTLGAADKLLDYYRRVQPPVLKTLVLEHDVLQAVKRVAPGTKIIFRHYASTQDYGAGGARWINELVDRVRGWAEIDYVEGYNEVGVFDLGELARYAAHERDRVAALAAVGKRAVVGNFSTGVVGDEQMRVLLGLVKQAALSPDIHRVTDQTYGAVVKMADRLGRDAFPFVSAVAENVAIEATTGMLQYAHSHNALLGEHEYSGPFMQWMAGGNQWAAYKAGTWTPDPCESASVQGWTTLRYRRFWSLMKAAGIGNMPIVITEGGIDDVQPRPGPQGKGWKSYKDGDWARLPVIGDYACQTGWFSRRLAEDQGNDRPLAFAWVDFGWASADPSWNSFRLDDDDAMRERVIAEQIKAASVAPPVTPPVTPPVVPPAVPPTNGRKAEAHVVVAKGDGWTNLARVALQREPKAAEVAEMRTYNGNVTLVVGKCVRSPWRTG